MQHFLWDLDGTIGNTLPLCVAAFRAAMEPLAGRTFGDDEITATFGPSEEGTLRALVPGHFDAGLASYVRCYEKLHAQWPEAFAGVPAILRDLKARGAFLALVTGKGPPTTHLTLRQFGLADVFEVIATGSPTGPVKDRQIEALIGQRGLQREEVLMIGDSPGDIHAARVCRIAVAAAAWAPTADVAGLQALRPDYLFTSVDDFRAFLGLGPASGGT